MRITPRRVTVVALAIGLVSFCAASMPQQAGVDECPVFTPKRTLAPNIPSWNLPDEVVVQFSVDAVAALRPLDLGLQGVTGFAPIDDIAAAIGATKFEPLYPGANRTRDLMRGLPDMTGWYTVAFDPTVSNLQGAMAALAASPFVLHVEPIGIHAVLSNANDPYYANQWFLNQASDHDIDAPEGWDIENGSPSIIVADLDTGCRYYHKDLGGVNGSPSTPTAIDGNIWINTAEKNGVAGVDDDGDGYVDDWAGWDFVSSPITTCWSGEDCSGADNDPRDFNGHGTHTGGLVAALNNNGYATASPGGGFGNGSLAATGDGVKLMVCRIGHSGNYGGQEVGFVSMAYAASAFYYAANKGAKIATCSWGSSNSGGIAAALDYFIAAGGLVFKAAGNDGSQTADYMCSRADVYSVVATDSADKKASFSTYGSWADISAPGVGIYSTYHVHTDPNNDYVASLDGTSMATPIVASVAAVVWSHNPSWTRTQVWDAVRLNCDNIDSLNPSYAGKLGAGRVNLQKALGGSSPPPPPGQKYAFSMTGSPTLPTIGTLGPNQLAQYDSGSGAWSLYFDGNDVGLSGKTISAFTRLANGSLLFSFTAAGSIAGLQGGPNGTNYDVNDILLFVPTSLGANTAGTWSFYFDGSDVGLTTNSESIDAIAQLPDGRLLISTSGNPSVPGLSGLADEDLIAFNATSLGSVTAGTWSYWFDGSDVGLADSGNEDIDGAFVDANGNLFFSTLGAFSVAGVSGGANDIVKFTPSSTGTNTAGTFSLAVSAAAAGIPSGANVKGIVQLP